MMRTIFGAMLAAVLLPAAAQTQTQTPAPAAAPPAAEAPKAHPPLKLQLDERDMRSLMALTPKDGEKKQDADLPTLGGKPSPNLERKISDVVPKDQAGGM
jgi:hypothetical protein